MQIKRLKLSGFKSFVEPTELRIERGLTGVVGPNGCGKSNLLEAIRWVMGEGSAKSLRGAGMEDVIFAGTQTRPSRDFAEVAIHAEADADNDDGEIEVVRRIERGAGSAYRINGRDVRAKDVGLLFADAATGAHSPALVSQGRIGAVIAAKPADRRQMLEEAAGISGLHVRRKDAEQKLRATETNLRRLDEVLADMETRIGQLRRQARAAERYRKLSEDIRTSEGKLIFTRWKEAAAAADRAKAEAVQAEQLVQAASTKQRELAESQSDATARLAAARSAALEARDRATDASHRLANARAERATLDRRITELAAQTERLEADREREGALAHDAAVALERLSNEAKMLEARARAAEAGRPELADRLARAEAASRDAEIELAQALSAQAREQAETRVAEAAVVSANARLERARRDLAQIEAQWQGLGSEEPLNADLQRAKAALAGAQSDAEAAVRQVAEADEARDRAAAARDAAQAALATDRASLAALESEARALEKAVARTSSKDRMLDRVNAHPGYERALAAALGDDLDAGLDAGDARHWAGADAAAGDPVLPPGLSALSSFVEAPPQLARRLSQVAVADQDEGALLSVGQRLVTRDGRLRRWDGYVARDQGAAAAERLVRLNRLVTLKDERAAAEASVSQGQATAAQAQSAMEAARASADAGRRAQADADNRARMAAREVDAAAAAIERLVSRRTEIAERRDQVADEVSEAEQEAEQAGAARAALPDGRAVAQQVAALQASAEAARSVVAQLRAESAGLDRAIAEDRARLAATQEESRDWKSRAGEAARRIEEMAKRARIVEAEALSLTEAPAQLDGRIAALEESVEQTASLAGEAAQAETAAEAVLRGLEAQLTEAGEALASAREARAGALARAENQELRRVEMGRVSGERFECPPPLLPERAGFDAESVRDPATESAEHDRLVADRERLGPVNLIAEQELAEIEGERVTSMAERDELTEAVNRLRGSIGSLNREGRTRLLAAFEEVNGHFQRLFTTLFNGGQAHLALIDSDDPLEAGLEIFAQPPGKRLQSLTLLSGGEQALTAVALIFGLFLTNPAPICVLDEVDAPLDDANIERFCDLLDRMTRETQTRYLIVTHNAVTMSRMHRLFGVTMVEKGVSRLVSVDLQGAEDLLAAE